VTGRAQARADAERVALRFGVKFASREAVQQWARDPTRTLFLLDVRTPDEFETAHIVGCRHAPGGQLVQATDEFIGVRNALVVLVDPARVRSVMTASWLNQMGWEQVYVLEPEGDDGFAGWPVEQGMPARIVPGFEPWQTVAASALADQMRNSEVVVVDISSSLQFRDRHIPGAWWAVRSRLEQAQRQLPNVRMLVLTSADGILAHLAAPEARLYWPRAEVRVLDGGNAAWFEAKLPVESGNTRATTTLDDIWYKPYEHAQDFEKHAQAYLSWEVALADQIRRDPTVRFRAYQR
jgi:rhodanese-related sulfurtransferase